MLRTVRQLVSIVSVAWGRTPVRWLWLEPSSDWDVVLQVASRHYHPAWNTDQHRCLLKTMYWLMLAIWPLRATILIVQQMYRHARQTKALRAVSYVTQLRELLKVAFLYQTSPQAYYLFEMHALEDLRVARTFLLENSMTALMGVINDHRADSHIEDKLEFNRSMREIGVPVADDVALVQNSDIRRISAQFEGLPGADLVMKPRYGRGGKGIYSVKWIAGGRYCRPDGTVLTTEQLRGFLKTLSVERDYLVQRRLLNHPAIADLCGHAFSTCRIVTGKHPQDGAEVILAVFKMSPGNGVADNFSTGGIASRINLSNGELGPAVYKFKLLNVFDVHPVSGATITGRKLPFWKETVELATRAHQQIDGDFPFLAWDIGIAEKGPVVVETQASFGFILCERPGCVGIGSTRFPHLYVEWLRHMRYQHLH